MYGQSKIDKKNPLSYKELVYICCYYVMLDYVLVSCVRVWGADVLLLLCLVIKYGSRHMV